MGLQAARRVAATERGNPMFETPFTIVGNIVNDPVHRRVGEHEVFKFRVASNSRRRTAEGTWEQGDSLFASVSCWGRLVAGTAASLVKGDPVIVVGNVYTSEYEDKEGIRRTSVEIRATAVGPDLARSTARIDRTKRQADDPAPQPSDEDVISADEDSDDTVEGLPLTA
jgi:single-strand DNA-binding protein